MTANHHHQIPMLLVLLGMAVLPFAARRLRLPSSALEIVYGMLLFNLVLDSRPEWFELLREIGFIYLMFIAGMELDLRALRRSGRSGWYLLIALASFLLTPLAFTLIGIPFFLGVSVAMISAGIVIPVLKELDLLETPFGHTVIGVALTGELLSILVLTLIDLLHLHGLSLGMLLSIGKLALLFGLAYLVLKIVYMAAWWHPERVTRVMESEDPVEEGIRVLVTMAFAGAVLAGMAGAEPILGSFLGGMIFSLIFRGKGRFEEKINAVGFGFLIPFFFIGVGAGIDLRLLLDPGVIGRALLLTLAVLASNLVTLPLGRPLGLNLREAFSLAVILSAPLSMIVVAGTLGQNMGLLSETSIGTLVLTALLSSVIYPSLFRVLARRPLDKGAAEH
ncbi:MAG: cation:proton antiporter [Geothermobacteraceae bacterium]